MVLVEGKQQKRGGEKTVEMRLWQQRGNIRNAVVVVLVEGKRQKFGGSGGGGRGYTYCHDIAGIIDSSQVKNAKMLFCIAFVNRQSSSLRSICSGF